MYLLLSVGAGRIVHLRMRPMSLVAVATVVVAVAMALQAAGAGHGQNPLRRAAQLLAGNAGAGRSRRTVALVVVAISVILSAPVLFFAFLLGSLLGSDFLGSAITSEVIPASTWPTLLIGALLLVVLIIDELTVAKLRTSSFRRDSFDPDARRAPSEWERLARCLGHDSFRTELHRVAHSDESAPPAGQADVIVYRGYHPFIGAGDQVDHHVIALPLEPSQSAADPVPINVNGLHHHVAECLATLRSPSSLGPGRRLEQLRRREQVLLPAERLLVNRFAQMNPPVLPDLSHPPLTHLPLSAARALAEDPLEWARYYSCFRVEAWDRDLTTSCYLHIGTDQHMLYLEWTYCVLFPVDERYRSIDYISDSGWATLSRSLVEWVLLPLSVARRFRSAFRRRTVLLQRPGELVPARYGAAQSLRELAADTDVQTYFQEADVERYVSIIDRVLLRAVGQFLEQRGYSVVEFMKMADTVVNNFMGNVNNSVIGSGNRNVRINAARPDGTKGSQ
jgi:hypothetical protein